MVEEFTEREQSTREIITLLIHGVREIRERLKLDEEYYVTVYPTASPYGRSFYLYGVLDQVERACFAHSRMDEALEKGMLGDLTDDNIGRRLRRNFLHTVHAEGALWARKLTEVLTELILFSTTNTDPYYRYFLLKHVIEDYARANADYGRYFSGSSNNIAHMLDSFRTTMAQVEPHLDLSRCWYLQATKRGRGTSFASSETCLMQLCHSRRRPRSLHSGFPTTTRTHNPAKAYIGALGL